MHSNRYFEKFTNFLKNFDIFIEILIILCTTLTKVAIFPIELLII